MFEDIYDKKVLITGSSSGIGFEIAKSFAERNCQVVLFSQRSRTSSCWKIDFSKKPIKEIVEIEWRQFGI